MLPCIAKCELVIMALFDRKLSVFDKFNDIYIHVALDNMVFIDDISKNTCEILNFFLLFTYRKILQI